MQVMPSTARNPGFGIAPAQSDSPAEYDRVGNEYLNALHRRYGDPAKMWAAYNAGPGRVDSAIRAYGDNWLKALPSETQNYVAGNVRAMGGM
jgi:soluble lytic murein transglycosylase-like protein